MRPVLHDAVTLCHFAAARALAVLQSQHAARPGPRWTAAVRNEIATGAREGVDYCSQLLDRVIDSIAILRNTVHNKAISAQQAVEIANSIEAAGRHFRPEHRDERGAAYFE